MFALVFDAIIFLVFQAKHIFKEEPKEPKLLFSFNTPHDVQKWQVLCDRDVGGAYKPL